MVVTPVRTSLRLGNAPCELIETNAMASSTPVVPPSAALANHRILIVEDNDTTRRRMTTLLCNEMPRLPVKSHAGLTS